MLLEAKNLVKNFPVQSGFWGRTKVKVHAVNQVSLSVKAGQTIGLVGESGCGKTTLARLLMRLIDATEGEIFFEGQNLTTLSESQLRPLRKSFQMIFQDPYSSLNPRMNVGQTLLEPLKVHQIGNFEEQENKVFTMLEKVGLSKEDFGKYPHEFSGGQRQRVGIARSLMLAPKLILADEPVSALDVSIQAQIINLLMDLQEEMNLTYIFIAHDLKVVRHISKKIMVMYLGKIVEEIPSDHLAQARHPYTHALLAAVPLPDPRRKKEKIILSGDVPSPINPPPGCAFHTRCPYAQKRCQQEIPNLTVLQEEHHVACHLTQEVPPFEKTS